MMRTPGAKVGAGGPIMRVCRECKEWGFHDGDCNA